MSKATKQQAAELRRLAAQPDEDIDLSDSPEVSDFHGAKPGRFFRPVKQQVTIRLDADLLAWFRSQGKKYQTRINAALREHMESHRGNG